MDLDEVDDPEALSLQTRPFGARQRALKRGVDLVLGAAALVLTIPLWAIIAGLIRLTTREPALFRQERIGHNGVPFVMYKFRSMAGGPDESAEGTDRVTPIGRFLRKYSLDELPQLLNVLKGDMSLVGPRPELPRIVARYEPWQRKRLEVKPGMTGLWQILGRKDLPLTDNIHYDFYYIRNQSLVFDVAILLRTIPAVLSGKGAY